MSRKWGSAQTLSIFPARKDTELIVPCQRSDHQSPVKVSRRKHQANALQTPRLERRAEKVEADDDQNPRPRAGSTGISLYPCQTLLMEPNILVQQTWTAPTNP